MSRRDYFVSDVEIAAERPHVTERFLGFLEKVRSDGRRLFLLGDIFDYWVGGRQAHLDYVRPLIDALRGLVQAGVEVHYLAGNRDYGFDVQLDGEPVARPADQLVVESGGRRLLLEHGDLLCTGDRAYRRWRAVGRSIPVRFALSAVPLALAAFLGRGYRRLSVRIVARKTRREMAVNFAEVRRRLLQGHDVLVCGHFHRAARYRVGLPERRSAEFITLGGWERHGTYLVGDDQDLQLHKYP